MTNPVMEQLINLAPASGHQFYESVYGTNTLSNTIPFHRLLKSELHIDSWSGTKTLDAQILF